MRTIKTLTMVAAILFVSFTIKAQDTTKPFYFPHKTGDMWEYFYDDYSPLYVDTLQNSTIFDSVDSHGLIYIKQHAQFINPIEPAVVLFDTTKYWVDTVNNFVYSHVEDAYDKLLVYKLNAKKGDQWILVKGGTYEMARVNDKWDGSIFGKKTTFMSIIRYMANDSTDTTGYSIYGGDVIADGFGLIARGGGESPGEIHLIGAVINGKQYGNITVVSVKDKNNPIPTDIKLYPNYPNPFNPSTTIRFELSSRSSISLIIYGILGKEIMRLIDNEDYPTGLNKIIWNGTANDGRKVSSGIYFYRLITNKQILTKSMILLK